MSTSGSATPPLEQVSEVLRSMFALPNLTIDPFVVLNMTPELWIPLKLLSMLECIRRHTYDLRVVRKAAIACGLEHDPATDSVRPSLHIERLTLTYLPGKDTTEEEVQALFSEFSPVAFWKQGDRAWYAKLKSEPEAESMTLRLREQGYAVGLEAENPYIYLLSHIHANLPRIQSASPICHFFLLGLHNNPAGRHYSRSALEEILHGMKRLEMPVIMRSLQELVPVISRKPRPFLKPARTIKVH